jgi:alanine racemase
MSLRTRVALLKSVPAGTPLSYGRTFVAQRPSRIATLPVGYGDGYPRLLSNRGRVLVGGQSVPLVGRVCMDLLLADVTDVPGAREGDEAVLFGRQGDARIGADDLARLVGTIHYEITCNVGKRVPREYVGGA